MQLLERADLVRKLETYVAGIGNGAGKVVCVVGEAGIGKTSITQVTAERAATLLRLFWGACEDLSTPAPLAPVQDFAREGSWRLPPADDLASRLVFFETAFSLLSSEPTLAVIEDLHWADDATLDFVRFVARRIRTAPLLLLVTARDDSTESQGRFRRALADAPPDSCERIELQRLTQETVVHLARQHGADGAAVYSLTSGNPFLTIEVLRQGNECPATVRDALLWRADKLPPGARAVLDAASIFPRRVERRVLVGMNGASGEDVTDCLSSGLLQVDRDFYAFRHEIARRAIEAALPQSLRMNLNQRALDVLRRDRIGTTARLVHHAVMARDAPSIQALAPIAAAEAADAGAHREAADHLKAALIHVDSWEAQQRAELLERLGYELQLTAEVTAAIDAYQAAFLLRQQVGDQLKAGDDLRWIARLHYNVGDRENAYDIGRRAINMLEPLGQTYELAMAYANLALLSALRDDRESAILLANNTVELAEKLERKDLLADAHGTLGVAKQWVDPSSSRKHLREALRLSLECNRTELVARTYLNAGNIALNAHEDEDAHWWLEAGVSYCAARDLTTWEIYMNGLLGQLLLREGKWPEAERLAQEALESAATPVTRFPSSAALARIRIRRGEEADSLIDNLTFDAEPQRLMTAAPIIGERSWLLRLKVDSAVKMLSQAAGVAEVIGNIWAAGGIEYWRSKLEGRGVYRSITAAEPFALLFSGDWVGAAESWKALNSPYDRALALLEGDEEACDEALSILDALGAPATASRARQELRARGFRGLRRGPRASTRSNPAGLTMREMDVLRLLESGRSNAEIAGKLNTAPKTVDHHVSAILAKLDASSRLEAVANARKRGLIDGKNQSSS